MSELERNSAVIGKVIGLKKGDVLVSSDGSVRAEVEDIGDQIRVRVRGETGGNINTLRSVSHQFLRLYKGPARDLFELWTFGGETLRSLYERSRAAIQTDKKRRKAPGRRHWFRDCRADGNLFLLRSCLVYTENFLSRCKGSFKDEDLFAPVAKLMSWEKLIAVFNTCTNETVRKEMSRQEYGRITEPEFEMPHDLLKALWLHPGSNARFRLEIGVWLKAARELVDGWLAEEPDPVAERMAELRRLMAFDEDQMRLLTLAAAVRIAVLPCDDLQGEITANKLRITAAMLGLTESGYLDLVAPSSRLVKLGCLDLEGDIEDGLLPYLRGFRKDPLSSKYFVRCGDPPLPWAYFGRLSETHGALLKRMVVADRGRGANVLLYGEPGTGKTSFAVSLAAELGRAAYLIPLCEDKMKASGRTFRFAALQVCDGQVDPDKSIIIIDEADEMLEGASGGIASLFSGEGAEKEGKGLLNDVMEKVKTPCVWIANSKARDLDSSNRRRFDYSVRFDKLTRTQRESIWRNAAAKNGVALPEGAGADLAARYEASAGGISQALANLAVMGKDAETVLGEGVELVERMLAQHCELLGVRRHRIKGEPAGYALDGLNVKGAVTPERLLEAAGRYLREKEDALSASGDRPLMNVLLSGPPGTGKTEFVRHMGRVLDRRVLTRLGGDLLDRYVGGTEERIRQAFAEAEAENAILFLDEMDGLLQSRERASHSWEVTQVNELLHMMENFEGVLVGATNFADALDPATLRRFTFKLEFAYLTDEGKRLLFGRLFPDLNALTQTDASRLSRIARLAPGDFRTVRQVLISLGGGFTAAQVLEGLERESAAKRMGAKTETVGFRCFDRQELASDLTRRVNLREYKGNDWPRHYAL